MKLVDISIRVTLTGWVSLGLVPASCGWLGLIVGWLYIVLWDFEHFGWRVRVYVLGVGIS